MLQRVTPIAHFQIERLEPHELSNANAETGEKEEKLYETEDSYLSIGGDARTHTMRLLTPVNIISTKYPTWIKVLAEISRREHSLKNIEYSLARTTYFNSRASNVSSSVIGSFLEGTGKQCTQFS